jgi:hypothetical protein
MKSVYKVLAYLVAIEVAVQAMAIVYAVAGLGKWVADGGVMDQAAMENQSLSFDGSVGFLIHGLNGMMLIPLLALLLLISSFFARVQGGVKWAGLVLLLVILQVTLGLVGHAVPAVGGLHGLNALLLFSCAIYTARRSGYPGGDPVVEPDERLATSA